MFNKKLKQRVTDLENELWCMKNPDGIVVKEPRGDYSLMSEYYILKYYYSKYDFVILDNVSRWISIGRSNIVKQNSKILISFKHSALSDKVGSNYLVDTESKTVYLVDDDGRLI